MPGGWITGAAIGDGPRHCAPGAAGLRTQALAIAPGGRAAYVSGGGADGTLTAVDPFTAHVHDPIAVGRHPRGLALAPDGARALVALNGEGAVLVVALADGRVQRRIDTHAFPAQ